MADEPKITETPRQKLAQAAILINGGAATAILAFLSTYLSKSPSPPTGILGAAALSLMGYAFGVCFGAISIWSSSQASAQFGLAWEAFLDDPPKPVIPGVMGAEEGYRASAEKWLRQHRLTFA